MLPLFISAIENDDDRQFVADIYTRYQPALYRKAQKVLHDNDRAEEAVHEAMLRVIRYLDRVREIPSDELLPYLITIVQTTSIPSTTSTRSTGKRFSELRRTGRPASLITAVVLMIS